MQLKYFSFLLLLPAFCGRTFAQNNPDLTQTAPSGTSAGMGLPAEVSTASGVNTITTYVPVIPVSDALTLIPGVNPDNVKQRTVFTDGTNTPFQSVNRYVSLVNGQAKHLVQLADNRPQKEQYSFLPFASGSGSFVPDAFAQQKTYYGALYGNEGYTSYSKAVNSSAAETRALTSYAPGKSQVGQSHGTVTRSIGNLAGEVRMWDLDGNGLPVSPGFYAANELFGTETVLPAGSNGLNYFNSAQTKTFTDKEGKLILKMVADDNYHPVGSAQVITYQYTYYVYDVKGNLLYTIPPKAYQCFVQYAGLSAQAAENLCFRNSYDAKGRLTGTHKPGETGMTYVVYDRKDRPVMRQAPNAFGAEWEITFYNSNGTVKATSVFESDKGQASMQLNMDSWTGGTTAELFYYLATAQGEAAIPAENAIAGNTMMSYATYDNYTLADPGGLALASYGNGQGLLSSEYYNAHGAEVPQISMRVHGMPTGSMVRILPTEGNIDQQQAGKWRTSVNFYDDKGRVVYTVSRDLDDNNNVLREHYTSMQYDFAGRAILSKHVVVNNYSAGQTGHVEFTKSQFEKATGNLLKTWHKVDDGTWVMLAAYAYDDMGRVKRKSLGNGGEVQDYSYNMRGQLTGINGEYAETGNKAGLSRSFGESLKYDYGFTNNRYDGKLTGMVWRGSSMQEMYAYGYSYFQNQGLKKADFNTAHLGGTGWNHTDIDYSVSNLVYDKNGNIQSMDQRGVQPGAGPVDMDMLTYGYADWSNKLMRVQDGGEDIPDAGDFKEGNIGNVDGYQYDRSGNITRDMYKGVESVHYTRFNKPSQVAFQGGRVIEYAYDAAGNKLQELVKDDDNGILKATEYIGNFVYENNRLQYILTGEGRTVFDDQSASPAREEYFVKDHLGNVRSVINTYTYLPREYFAGYELASANLESLVFDNLDEIREYKPGGNQGDYMAAMLDGADPKSRIGSSLLVHVMAGDRVSMNVNNYYESYNHYDESIADGSAVLESLVNTLTGGAGGFAGSESHNTDMVGNLFNGANFALYSDLVTGGNTDPSKPKSYLNYVLFNENMQIVQSMTGAFQANGDGNWTEIGTTAALEVPENGYLAIYLSNSSIVQSTNEGYHVFYDRLRFTVTKGSLLEETHYYPFGLPIKGIGGVTTPDEFKANRRKYQGNEYITDLGLHWMDFNNRQYDPQLGRFLSIDPLAAANGQDMFSPYAAMGNTPEVVVDPNGLSPEYNLDVASVSGGGGGSSYAGNVLTLGMGSGDGYGDNRAGGGSMAAALSAFGLNGCATVFEYAARARALNEMIEGAPVISEAPKKNFEDGEVTGTAKGGDPDPQSGGNKRELPKGMDPVESKDPLKTSNGERVYTIEEFAEYNKGLKYEEIINQRPKRTGGEGGPDLRYVLNPRDGNIMDMRHVLVVGYGYGVEIGKAVEALQWFSKSTRPSAYNRQDYYSNRIGDNFSDWYMGSSYRQEFKPVNPDFSHSFMHYILFHRFDKGGY